MAGGRTVADQPDGADALLGALPIGGRQGEIPGGLLLGGEHAGKIRLDGRRDAQGVRCRRGAGGFADPVVGILFPAESRKSLLARLYVPPIL